MRVICLYRVSQKNWAFPNWAFPDLSQISYVFLFNWKQDLQKLNLVKLIFFKTPFIFLFSFLFQWKNDKSRWGTFSGLYRCTTTWPTRGWRTKTSTLKMRSQPSSFHWRSTKIYLWSWQIHTVLKLINLVFWPSVLKLYTLTQGDLIAVGTKKGQLWLLNESSLQPIRPQPFTYSKVGWRPIIFVFNFRDVSHNCK